MVAFHFRCNREENIAKPLCFAGAIELKDAGELIVGVESAASRNAFRHRRVERAVVRKLDRADPRKSYCARVYFARAP